jgi:hypothetical protein
MNYWFAQWKEEGDHRTKELGLCSKVNRIATESLLQEILRQMNEAVERRESANSTLEQFVELVFPSASLTPRTRCPDSGGLTGASLRKKARPEINRPASGTRARGLNRRKL